MAEIAAGPNKDLCASRQDDTSRTEDCKEDDDCLVDDKHLVFVAFLFRRLYLTDLLYIYGGKEHFTSPESHGREVGKIEKLS